MEQHTPSTLSRLNAWAGSSVTLKLFVIALLILLLMIPSAMISSLVREREVLRDSAINEISSKWGGSQVIGSPVISVPYRTILRDEKGVATESISYAHFLPDKVTINGTLTPEKRQRGIYVVMLYNSVLELSGDFGTLDIEALPIKKEQLLLDEAFITIGITDMKGIRESISLQLGDKTLAMEPGLPTHDIFASGVSLPIKLQGYGNLAFSTKIQLNGSSSLFFVPYGKENNVQVSSTWGNPSFEGVFLPDQRQLSANGFSATWKVLDLNRNYPQQGVGSYISQTPANYGVETAGDYRGYKSAVEHQATRDPQAMFGVKLLLPVDEYKQTMRSTKYNMLFVVITFLTFFFIEILNRRRLHPIQYLLIGAAICLFYILLLSFSEHLHFDMAYLLACGLITGLITLYAKAVLQNGRLTLLVFGVLFILYAFFYSLLQLEDYALLLGSLGLLLILAVIMYLTRNIDWYKLNKAE